MLVTVEDPVAVSATHTFSQFSSELFVPPNNGANIAPPDARTARGGINLQPDPDNRSDQNPERVQIQFDGTLFLFPVPAIGVGDWLGDVTGVVGYSFGNFEVNTLAEFAIMPSELGRETTSLTGTEEDVIRAEGGPQYAFFDVAPADGTSGGAPGSNIRNAFRYNPKRVKLVDFQSLTSDVNVLMQDLTPRALARPDP